MTIPQTHLPGTEAEVDFGEFYEILAGEQVKCHMFVMRLSHSGLAFHHANATQAQESFLDGHVRAFGYFGGVPAVVRYDNLKPAVVRVVDRVTFNAHILETGTQSYRMRTSKTSSRRRRS